MCTATPEPAGALSSFSYFSLSFHRAKKGGRSQSVELLGVLCQQPPCCPEVNPIERVSLYLQNLLAWGNFNSLDNLRSKLYHLLNSLSNDTIGYLMGWSGMGF